jgi:hypothetical protein
MRWYVNRNGENGGPYPEGDIRKWVFERKIGPEAQVRAEFDPVPDRWYALQDSPFERLLPSDQRRPERKRAELRNRVLVFGIPVAIVGACSALLAVRDPSKPKPAPVAAPAVYDDARRDLCPGERRVPSAELWACTETGTRDEPIALRDVEGQERGQMDPPKRIARLRDSESGPEEIRREPGHMDQKVCILEGPHAGRVLYLKNTLIFGHPCQL